MNAVWTFQIFIYSSVGLALLCEYLFILTLCSVAEPLNSSNNGATSVLDLEMIEFKVVYNKKTHNVRFPLDETVDHLKEHIESLTSNRMFWIYGIFKTSDN